MDEVVTKSREEDAAKSRFDVGKPGGLISRVFPQELLMGF